MMIQIMVSWDWDAKKVGLTLEPMLSATVLYCHPILKGGHGLIALQNLRGAHHWAFSFSVLFHWHTEKPDCLGHSRLELEYCRANLTMDQDYSEVLAIHINSRS